MDTKKYDLNQLNWAPRIDDDLEFLVATIFVGEDNDQEREVITDTFLETDTSDAELVVFIPGSSSPDDSASSHNTMDWPILDELFGREHWREFIEQRTKTLRAELNSEQD